MNKLVFLLLFTFSLSTAGLATTQGRPTGNINRAFNHSSGATAGKNSGVRFRRESVRPVIDLHPHTPEKFKTAKVNHHYYRFAKGR